MDHLIGDCRKLQAEKEQEQKDVASGSGCFSRVQLSGSPVPSPIVGKLLPSFYTDKGVLSPGTTSQIIYAPESVTSTTSPVGKGIPPIFQCFSDKGILSQVFFRLRFSLLCPEVRQ